MSKQNLARFQEAWPEIDDERRRVIMQHLVELAETNFEVNFDPIFILGLNDLSPEVQAVAISGLWENESPALIPPLVHLLKNGQTVTVRASAAQALGSYIYLGEIEEIENAALMIAEQGLLSSIREPGEALEVIRRAIEAIAFSSQEGISEIIENAYYHENEEMQISAVFAMGRSGDKRWRKIVLTELESTDPRLRFEAARAAGELEIAEAVPLLIRMIDEDADSEVQQNAVWSLGQIGGMEAKETLENLTDSDDEALKTAAEDALDELILMSGDPDDIFSYTLGVEDDEDDDIHIVDLGRHNGHGKQNALEEDDDDDADEE
jgi:hypothetical protein